MPWFVVAAAAGATVALARKIISRHTQGLVAQRAATDPPDVRTVACFELAPGRSIDDALLAIAAELARDLEGPLEVSCDAVRGTCERAGRVDIVRLGRREGARFSLELTRAWTGVALGRHARSLLGRVHDALAPITVEVTWFARQDRAFLSGFAFPYDPQAIARG